MLGVVGVVFLVLAVADLVARMNGETKKPPGCDIHNWEEIVDDEDNHLNFICGQCKMTPSMIREEHLNSSED